MRFFLPAIAACSLAALGDPRLHVTAFLVIVTVWGIVAWRAGPAPSLAVLVLAALATRLPLLLLPPTLSDDVWRYVWEGRVWAHGASPFAYPPDAPELAAFRDSAWENVNHRTISSIYPPAAQLLFLVLHPGGPYAFRIAATLADVGTAVALARRSQRAGSLWAFLPLPALESAVSGHLESFGVLALVLALHGSDAAAWVGAMIKLLPGVVLVHARRRAGWAVLTALATIPLLGPGFTRGFTTYEEKWSFNGSAFPIVRALVGEHAARPPLQLVGAAVVAVILVRSRDRGRIALWTTGAFVVLSPTVHPWYVLWALAAGLWCEVRAWTILAVGVPLAYAALASYDAGASQWMEPTWPRLLFYPPFFAALVWEGWRRLTRPGPWPVH